LIKTNAPIDPAKIRVPWQRRLPPRAARIFFWSRIPGQACTASWPTAESRKVGPSRGGIPRNLTRRDGRGYCPANTPDRERRMMSENAYNKVASSLGLVSFIVSAGASGI